LIYILIFLQCTSSSSH